MFANLIDKAHANYPARLYMLSKHQFCLSAKFCLKSSGDPEEASAGQNVSLQDVACDLLNTCSCRNSTLDHQDA